MEWPTTDQGWCDYLRAMDAKYGTPTASPLHHDNRCEACRAPRMTTWTPEPCQACDAGQACDTHALDVPWARSWLTASENKGA